MTKRLPLAVMLRPKTLDEIVGQEHLLGKDAKLRKLIESDKLTSVILWGPPGVGKTTIAELVASYTKSQFIRLNATQSTVKDIRKYGEAAKQSGIPVVAFVDEVHRANRVFQDILLPYTENGDIILIGATISNPYFSVDSALLSRCQMICELKPLTTIDLAKVLLRGIQYYKSQNINISIEQEAAKYLINVVNGDARKILATLEVATILTQDTNEIKIAIDLLREIAPSKYYVYSEDMRYQYASAYQGSIQASDPNSAIYWLACWLEAGEDIRYIARRLITSASEDACGNPEAAMVAHNAYVAACEIGRPECDIILAHATILTATAPRNKSAACAIWAALKDVREGQIIEVPNALKDCHYAGSKELGHGEYHDGMNQDAYIGVDRVYYHPEKWQK